jgi:probable dihydroxyacetone kinase regulator
MSNTTKRALEASLKNLLLKKPLDKITISDIANDCGISRMTFYYHFKDIYDLVEWACIEDASKALDGKKNYDDWQEGFLQIFEAVLDNKPFILNVYHSVSREQVETYLYKLTYDLMIGVVEELAQNMSVKDSDKAFIANFYKYAFVGLMLDWIRNSMKEDPEEIIKHLSILVQGNIATQDESFGHPDKFCSMPEQTNWMSATVTTLDDKIPPYVQKICKRDPFSGKVVTGGIVTAKDSNWLLSWTFNRQPQFRNQPKGQLVGWIYGLFSDKPGNFVKKTMRQCSGKEICMEWLYHMGVPVAEIEEMAEKSANTIPCMMPYITAFFMPREAGDRPAVVPEKAVNFAFLGQFAETERDTIFTTEYSIRTGMEAVYTLLEIDRGVPEVWGSTYDVRDLLDSTVKLRDGKKLTDLPLTDQQRLALLAVFSKIQGTDVEKLLHEYALI